MTRTTANPVFYADELRMELADDPERLDRILTAPASVDLVTWNVFAALDTHGDRDYLAYRLQALGGAEVRPPIRLSLWTGRDREPRLEPPPAYVAAVRERAAAVGGDAASVAEFARPVEVPVRVESPDVLVLVETMWDDYPVGNGGRDRITELVDAGLEHARRLGKTLAVAVVYPSGTEGAAEASAQMQRLRQPGGLAAALPHRAAVPPVVLRELPWQQLLRIWATEAPYLRLGGQPVRPFRQYVTSLGLL